LWPFFSLSSIHSFNGFFDFPRPIFYSTIQLSFLESCVLFDKETRRDREKTKRISSLKSRSGHFSSVILFFNWNWFRCGVYVYVCDLYSIPPGSPWEPKLSLLFIPPHPFQEQQTCTK
jgi:hypothetical protein